MADNVRLSAGSNDGATIATDDDGVAQHQYVKLEFGADNTQTKVTSSEGLPTDPLDRAARDLGKVDIASLDQLPTTDYDTGAGTQTVPMIGIALPASGGSVPGGTSTAPFQVSLANTAANATAVKVDGSAVTQPVSAASLPLPTGAATAAKQPALGTAGTASADVITIQGIASMTAVKVDGSAVTQPVSGTVSITANSAVNVAQMNGVATTMGNGVSGTGVQRVTIASDSTGTLAGVTTVSTVTSLTQMNGQAIAMGTGVRSAGTQRVTIATDDVVPASQSGTWTVQPGNTANTTPWLVSQTPATSGGLSISQTVSAASTNATNVKASAGQLYGWAVFNTNASTRYVKLHNTAGTPTAGSGVVLTIAVPGGGGSNISLASGIAFSTGLAFTMVTGSATTDATAVASGDLISNLFYK